MDDDFSVEYIFDEYTLPASIVPLNAWDTADLVIFQNAINAELQRRYAVGEAT